MIKHKKKNITKQKKFNSITIVGEKNKSVKRFTLIELIIVIIVIGILAGMALPKFNDVVRDARFATLQKDIDVIETALNLYDIDNNTLPLGEQINSETIPKIKSLTSISRNKVITYHPKFKEVLEELEDTGSELYEINLEELNPYIERIKNKDEIFIYSKESGYIYYPKGIENSKGEVLIKGYNQFNLIEEISEEHKLIQ